MGYSTIKSYAKVNLVLNIVGKSFSLHKIESIISFIDLYDKILIKKIKQKNHKIKFTGQFSRSITKNNTITKLFKILDEKSFLKNQKFEVIVKKNIPQKSGLGGGSMNAANVLKFLFSNRLIIIKKKQMTKIASLIGSDVILGLYSRNLVLKSDNKIKTFSNLKNIYALIIKPNIGCSTEKIYSKVKNFNKQKLNHPNKNMFNFKFLKKMSNQLEFIAFKKYPKLNLIKLFLEKLSKVEFVRMTGSGSAIIAYFSSKKVCEEAKKKANKQFRNYWCKTAKTI
jgi:4-diphosphocytidyl-2-C-methyl-D-erythritol kinase